MKAPEYTAEQLAFYRSFAECRTPWAPEECNDSEQCWVRCGPPSLSKGVPAKTGFCLGCNGLVARKRAIANPYGRKGKPLDTQPQSSSSANWPVRQ